MPVPPRVVTESEASDAYVRSLSELEKRVLSIAEDHLKTSFDLSRSSGFIAWKASAASAAKKDV
jgi:hypothetical protein